MGEASDKTAGVAGVVGSVGGAKSTNGTTNGSTANGEAAVISEGTRVSLTTKTWAVILGGAISLTAAGVLGYAMLVSRVGAVEKEQEKGEAASKALTESLQGVRENVAGLKAEVAGARTDVTTLKTSVDGARSDMAGVKADMNALAREVRMLARSREPR